MVEQPAPTPVRLHPNLPQLYRQKVVQLHEALQDPSIRDQAVELLRGLLSKVTVQPGEGYVDLVVEGAADSHAGPGLWGPGRGVRVLFEKCGKGGCGGTQPP